VLAEPLTAVLSLALAFVTTGDKSQEQRSKKMKLSNLIAGGIAMSLSFSSVAMADGENPMLEASWRVYVGAFNASVDSKIGIHGDTLPEIPPIDVEDVLGVEDSKVVALAGVAWHFKRRHAIEFEFFSLNRSDTITDTFTPPIQIGDFVIEDGQISSSYDTDLARLTYAYSIMRSERTDLQLMFGIHIAKLSVAVQLAGSVCGPTTTPSVPPGCPAASSGDDGESVTAPLPHFGVAYTYAITPTVAMNLAAKGFAIELDKIDGTIIELDADVAWQPWKNIGFGVGARYFKTTADSKGSELNGSFEFEYFGPMVYVQATF
jgi:hypothetical protein